MCESKAYLIKDGKEEMIFEGIDAFEAADEYIRLQNIFGEVKKIKARIKKMSLLDHKIILEAL